MIKTAAVFSAAVWLVCPPILDAQVSSRDWPQWRGPTRDGLHSDLYRPGDLARTTDVEEVLAAFDAANGNQLWRSSSPAAYTGFEHLHLVAAGHCRQPALRQGRRDAGAVDV